MTASAPQREGPDKRAQLLPAQQLDIEHALRLLAVGDRLGFVGVVIETGVAADGCSGTARTGVGAIVELSRIDGEFASCEVGIRSSIASQTVWGDTKRVVRTNLAAKSSCGHSRSKFAEVSPRATPISAPLVQLLIAMA